MIGQAIGVKLELVLHSLKNEEIIMLWRHMLHPLTSKNAVPPCILNRLSKGYPMG